MSSIESIGFMLNMRGSGFFVGFFIGRDRLYAEMWRKIRGWASIFRLCRMSVDFIGKRSVFTFFLKKGFDIVKNRSPQSE